MQQSYPTRQLMRRGLNKPADLVHRLESQTGEAHSDRLSDQRLHVSFRESKAENSLP